jgi:hypothetical protein
MIAQLVLVDKKLVSLWIQKLEETSKAAKRHVNGTLAWPHAQRILPIYSLCTPRAIQPSTIMDPQRKLPELFAQVCYLALPSLVRSHNNVSVVRKRSRPNCRHRTTT